jgi:hypothetical protein
MNRWNSLAFSVIALLLLAASPGPSDPANLVDEADAAFARGEYALAEQLYAKAELRTADPGRVAFGLAASKYRLAAENPAHSGGLLAEAESLYRCCLDSDDPLRAEALVGVGNCLVREAGSRDVAAARAAAERFADAQKVPGGTALAEISRYNLQRARLVGRQIPTAPPEPKKDKPPPGDESDKDPKPPESSPPSQDQAEAGDGKNPGSRAAKADGSQSPMSGDESHSPGKGELPPVPDRDGVPPLTLSEAREHLEQVSRLINEESRRHRRGSVRPAAPAVRDW